MTTTAQGSVVVEYNGRHLRAVVTRPIVSVTGLVDDVQLWWTDYVANDWTENYRAVSQALLRLALLVAIDEAGGNGYFDVVDAKEFGLVADGFLAEQVDVT